MPVRREDDHGLGRLFENGAREALGGGDLFGAPMDRTVGQPDQRGRGVGDRNRPGPHRDRHSVIAIAHQACLGGDLGDERRRRALEQRGELSADETR